MVGLLSRTLAFVSFPEFSEEYLPSLFVWGKLAFCVFGVYFWAESEGVFWMFEQKFWIQSFLLWYPKFGVFCVFCVAGFWDLQKFVIRIQEWKDKVTTETFLFYHQYIWNSWNRNLTAVILTTCNISRCTSHCCSPLLQHASSHW